MSRLRLDLRRDDRNAATRKVIADAATQNRLRWREAVRDPFLPSLNAPVGRMTNQDSFS